MEKQGTVLYDKKENKMEKKKIIKSFDNLTADLQQELKERYPYGYGNKLIRLQNAKKENFFVVPLEMEDVTYMVKVQLEKPKKKVVEEEEEFDNTKEDSEEKEGGDDDDEQAGGKEASYEPNYDDSF
jgi:hypothetical protein